jgi:hypothetical protein
VATPSGSLFCRACILENLLAQREAIAAHKAAFDADQQRLTRDAEADEHRKATAHIVAFEASERGVGSASTDVYRPAGAGAGPGPGPGPGSAAAVHGAGSDSLPLDAQTVARSMASRAERIDGRSKEEKQTDVARVSFWAAAAMPTAAASRVRPPDPHPRDPVSGTFLRAKELMPLDLLRMDGGGEAGSSSSSSSSAAAAAGSTSGGEAGSAATGSVIGVAGAAAKPRGGNASEARFGCPACLKGIVYQRTFLLKGCRHVVCDKCVLSLVVPSKACPRCDVRVAGKGDLVPLQMAGSSFAGNEGTQAEAKRYTISSGGT